MITSKKIHAPEFIPQKAPFVFVDELYELEGRSWKSSFVVPQEHVFVEDGKLLEAGLIEVMAQSVAGGMTVLNSDETPRIGFIGEVKGFKWMGEAHSGDLLEISIEVVNEVFSVLLIQGKISSKGKMVAEGNLKLVLQDQ